MCNHRQKLWQAATEGTEKKSEIGPFRCQIIARLCFSTIKSWHIWKCANKHFTAEYHQNLLRWVWVEANEIKINALTNEHERRKRIIGFCFLLSSLLLFLPSHQFEITVLVLIFNFFLCVSCYAKYFHCRWFLRNVINKQTYDIPFAVGTKFFPFQFTQNRVPVDI